MQSVQSFLISDLYSSIEINLKYRFNTLSMEECVKCRRDENSCKLVDAIYENEIVKICEECAVNENFPIIRRPNSFQLKASEKPFTVYQRLARMAGIKTEKKEEKLETKGITLDKLRPAKDYSQLRREREIKASRFNKPLDLVDNFNWHIQMIRRDKKMTVGQLASSIGESESALKMIEQNNLPDDADMIIEKIEQFLKIKLRKSEVEKEQARIEKTRMPARILDFKPDSMKNITISDLKKMKDDRAEQEAKEREFASKLVWNPPRPSNTPEKKEEKVEKKTEETKMLGDDIEILDE